MNYTLSSDKLSVSVKSQGAEITSVVRDGIEYMWQAKPEVWARHAPVLFPIVGRLKNDTFRYRDQNYSLPQHGFARDMEFTLADQSPSEIKFVLVSNEKTKAVFPFEFNLAIKYSLKSDMITCTYEVNNVSTEILSFSIGAHPGFKVPHVAHEKFEDFQLKFKAGKQYEITLLKDGLLSDTKEKFFLHNGEVNLNTALFDKDALVFENEQVDLIELTSFKSGHGVELSCKGWPYFGIWSKKGCGEFVCLEPWCGITDTFDANGDLRAKKGIINLEAAKKFERSFSMRFF